MFGLLKPPNNFNQIKLEIKIMKLINQEQVAKIWVFLKNDCPNEALKLAAAMSSPTEQSRSLKNINGYSTPTECDLTDSLIQNWIDTTPTDVADIWAFIYNYDIKKAIECCEFLTSPCVRVEAEIQYSQSKPANKELPF